MLLLKTAFKNILAAGKRTWLNVAALSFTFVLMLAYNGLHDGWLEKSRTDTEAWQTGGGQLWHSKYDPFDIFTLQDAQGSVPADFQTLIDRKQLTPVLAVQASLYPNGRMVNVIAKGIDPAQDIVKIPTGRLKSGNGELPVVIGAGMARAANLSAGDKMMIRWRDRNGVFDARELTIAEVFTSQVPAVEMGQIWLNINDLREMTGMTDAATYFIESENPAVTADTGEWLFKSKKFLMADIDSMEQAARVESFVIFALLMSIVLLAVFDTQMLNIFRRQKEIGTLIALGMTPRRVTRLFTLEGICYTLLAIGVSATWRTAFLVWFYYTGFPISDSMGDISAGLGNAMYPAFKLSTIAVTVGLFVGFSAFVSWLAARKIAKQNTVLLLKGKTI